MLSASASASPPLPSGEATCRTESDAVHGRVTTVVARRVGVDEVEPAGRVDHAGHRVDHGAPVLEGGRWRVLGSRLAEPRLQGHVSPTVLWVRSLVRDCFWALSVLPRCWCRSPEAAPPSRWDRPTADAANGATVMTISFGEALDMQSVVLGELADIAATIATLQTETLVTDTGAGSRKTAPDQTGRDRTVPEGESRASIQEALCGAPRPCCGDRPRKSGIAEDHWQPRPSDDRRPQRRRSAGRGSSGDTRAGRLVRQVPGPGGNSGAQRRTPLRLSPRRWPAATPTRRLQCGGELHRPSRSSPRPRRTDISSHCADSRG